MSAEREAQARAHSIYAVTNKCFGSTDFQVNQCSETVRRYILKTYIYSTLYCFSCDESIHQCIKNAFRYALFKFFGNIPHINIKNYNNANTRTSTLTVNAQVISQGDLHRKHFFSLFQHMAKTPNKLLKNFTSYAIYASVEFT